MNRDLVFFVAGLTFGMAGGFFLFRALAPELASGAGAGAGAGSASSRAGGPGGAGVQSRPSGVSASSIGLDEDAAFIPLDESEVARLTELAESRASDASVRAELGELYMNAGRFGEAIAWLEASVALEPRGTSARNRLAVAYLNEGRLTDAVAIYEETLSFAPDNPGSLLGLGRIKLYLQQDINGGLAMWEKLVELAPGSAEAESIRDELEALKSAHGS